MPRAVYFHIGAGKTGTSAIQVALVRNRRLLAASGFVYPAGPTDRLAREGQVTSGNAAEIAEILKATPTAPRDQRVEGRIGRDLARHPGQSLIYSSESFVGTSKQRFTSLVRFIRAAGAEVKVIYYVRHLMDFAVSRYGQLVKRGGYVEDFETYIRKYRSNIADVVRDFSAAVGRQNMILRLYDRERPHLVKGFLEIFAGKGERDWDLTAGRETINRSLTMDEIDLMLFVNRHLAQYGEELAQRLATGISDALISAAMTGTPRFVVTAEDLAHLKRNNADVVDYINDFVAGDFTLEFMGEGVVLGERPAPDLSGHNQAYLHVVEALLDRLVAESGASRWGKTWGSLMASIASLRPARR